MKKEDFQNLVTICDLENFKLEFLTAYSSCFHNHDTKNKFNNKLRNMENKSQNLKHFPKETVSALSITDVKYIPIQKIIHKNFCCKPLFYKYYHDVEYSLYEFCFKTFANTEEFTNALHKSKITTVYQLIITLKSKIMKTKVKSTLKKWTAAEYAELLMDVLNDFLKHLPEYLEKKHPNQHEKIKKAMIEFLTRSMDEEILYMKNNPQHYFELYLEEMKFFKFEKSQSTEMYLKQPNQLNAKSGGDVFA